MILALRSEYMKEVVSFVNYALLNLAAAVSTSDTTTCTIRSCCKIQYMYKVNIYTISL